MGKLQEASNLDDVVIGETAKDVAITTITIIGTTIITEIGTTTITEIVSVVIVGTIIEDEIIMDENLFNYDLTFEKIFLH
uniref:Uncharacterized protein n=1 Tax=Acrobeloides nanus TaxID=290746 RepID=A0A914DXM5_9BILA